MIENYKKVYLRNFMTMKKKADIILRADDCVITIIINILDNILFTI